MTTATEPNPVVTATASASTPTIPAVQPEETSGVLETETIREDRWVAVLLVLFAGLFTLILLWEPLSTLFR